MFSSRLAFTHVRPNGLVGKGGGSHDANDALALKAFGEFAAVKHVARFAGAVLHPCVLVRFVVEVVHVDAALGGVDFGAAG